MKGDLGDIPCRPGAVLGGCKGISQVPVVDSSTIQQPTAVIVASHTGAWDILGKCLATLVDGPELGSTDGLRMSMRVRSP